MPETLWREETFLVSLVPGAAVGIATDPLVTRTVWRWKP
jgi:hypothetical protein